MCYHYYCHRTFNQDVSNWIFNRKTSGTIENTTAWVKDILGYKKKDISSINHALTVGARMCTVGVAFFGVSIGGAVLRSCGESIMKQKEGSSAEKVSGMCLAGLGCVLERLPSLVLFPFSSHCYYHSNFWYHRSLCHW